MQACGFASTNSIMYSVPNKQSSSRFHIDGVSKKKQWEFVKRKTIIDRTDWIGQSVPVAALSTGKTKRPTLEQLSIQSASQTTAREQYEPVSLCLEEERLFLDYQTLPTNEICQGELNTPTIEKAIDFEIPKQQLTPAIISTDKEFNNDLSGEKQQTYQEEVPAVPIIIELLNQTEDTCRYQSITDLLQDEQMYCFDQESSEEMLDNNNNNNINNFSIMDFGFFESDDYISKPEELEMIKYLGLDDTEIIELEKIKESEGVQSHSPQPTIVIPTSPQMLIVQQMMIEPANEQQSQESIKVEDDGQFDLIKYIEENDSQKLTPIEEKSCPTFEGYVVDPNSLLISIKPEPESFNEPSTSTGVPSRIPSADDDSDYNPNQTRPRRQIRKRKHSSDSDFSIGTSTSSYNSTRQKKNGPKKRGRPAKEVITKLPTIEDYSHLPVDEAEFRVLRIKNNEASRKSRRKASNQQTKLENECLRLEKRKIFLNNKREQLDNDIETLKRWLLARG